MGCLSSKEKGPALDDGEKNEPGGKAGGSADPADVALNVSGRKSITGSEEVDHTFVAWSEMENAEEQDYLVEEEKDAQLDQLLEKQYSERHRKHEKSYNDPNFWMGIMNSIEPDPDGFQLTAPFTLKKAHMLYRHLKSGKARTIPRRFVYEVLIASCKHLEQQSKDTGALQMVPPPTNKAERLFVCGDTHGQLQDVLWIFELHNEPAPGNAYLFNGDMADRGSNAVEIFMLLLAYKLAAPEVIFMNRGNHEQRDLNERPFANGGGFAWEIRKKYPHDENLIELFQRFFMLLPVASVVGSWAFVIHGGLFRDTEVTLEDIKKINNKRQPPLKLENRDDELLFDALWADPHEGDGVMMGSARGGYSIQFGADVTKAFCKRTGVKSVIRSHQLPKRQRGFEITHNSMLLTIFSASNYGGVCRNRGGVLIFDEKGPAEVKEFYAPPLDEYRTMCDEKLMQTILERVQKWRKQSQLGSEKRNERKQSRKKSSFVDNMWTHLLFETDASGRLAPRDNEVLLEQTKAWEEEQRKQKHLDEARRSDKDKLDPVRESQAANGAGEASSRPGSGKGSQRSMKGGDTPREGSHRLVKKLSDVSSSIQKHSLVRAPLRSTRTISGSEDGSSPLDPDAVASISDGMISFNSSETYQVAYCVEQDMHTEADGDIVQSIRMQICRMKAELISAFVAAQNEQFLGEGKARSQSGRVQGSPCPDGAHVTSARSDKAFSTIHNLEYDRWLKVMSTIMPEYRTHFNGAYGPRLLATAPGEEAANAIKGKPVNFMRWLDRFQVTLAYEQYADFKRDVLTRVFENIKSKTKNMSMTAVLSYFDPNNDGAMRMKDVVNVLRDLKLGLPERQLQQLVYELGFGDPTEEVEPVEVLTMLIHGLSTFQRAASQTRTESRNSQAEIASTLDRLRQMLQANKSKVAEAFNGESIQHLFLKADSDSDGYLSYQETTKVLQQLMTVCESEGLVSADQFEKLCAHIDLSGDGNVTFVEFIAAFGLSDAQRGNFVHDDEGNDDISSHLAEEMMQQICSSLYERSHALQRAFMYLDDRGDGWIKIMDFEEARCPVSRSLIQLVLKGGIAEGTTLITTLYRPLNPMLLAALALQALLLVLASGGEQEQEKQLMMAPQVKDLVTSLRKSHLASPSMDPPEIDYNAFIQSFRVIDSALDPEGTGRH